MLRKKRPSPRRPKTAPAPIAGTLPPILAEGLPDTFRIAGASEGFELRADDAAAADGKPALKRFSMVAYTGAAMRLQYFPWPVVVDLEGMAPARGTGPIFRNHDPEQIVGHWEKVDVSAKQIKLQGVMSGVGECADEVRGLAANGFPWQASIGASAQRMEYVDRGETVKCNGRTFQGPLYVARQTVLGEVSFVPIGADQSTSAVVAAQPTEGPMNFEQWLQARGWDATKLTEQELKLLRAAFDFEQKHKPPIAQPVATPAPATPPVQAAAPATAPVVDVAAQMRTEAAAELNRQTAIRRICAAEPALETDVEANGQRTRVNILAHAVASNWTAQETELAVLRAGRPLVAGGLGYSTSAPELSEAVLEAAVLQAGRCELWDNDFYLEPDRTRRVPERIQRETQRGLQARYPDQVQQSAHTLFRSRISLQQLLVAAGRANGYRGPEVIRDDGGIVPLLRAQNWIQAEGASTASLSNILSNVLNKYLLQGYLYTEQTWRDVCGMRSVKDFKPTKSVNLLSDTTFLQVGPSGELKNAAISDQAFANQANTYGRILTVSRTHIINDDLGALTTIPILMGRGSGLKLNNVFWTLFLNPSYDEGGTTNFFAATHTLTAGQTGKSNLSTGAGSALGNAGLTAATLLFDKQVDPTGVPLGLDAEVLLYPPDLDTTARELMNAQFLVYGGGTASKQPNTNIWQGRFKPAKSRYLSNSAFTGYSATAWYLLANPNMLPVIEACFLNGQEQPTVQTAQADFDILGISIRGFFDFGVAMQNFRAGVKSDGA